MAQYEEVMKWVLPRYYDPRYAKFVRLQRSSEPVHIASLASTNAAVAGGTSISLCSTTFDAYTEGFLVAYGFSHSNTTAEMWFIEGNNTIVPQRIRDEHSVCQLVGDINVPLYRVDASETISARTDTAGTICAWATLIKFPIIDEYEPESV